MENQIPQLSLETLIRLSTHERRTVLEYPKVERTEATGEEATTGHRRGICLNLFMTMPQDQARKVMNRLLAEAEEPDDEPSMCLVKRSGSEIVEPE